MGRFDALCHPALAPSPQHFLDEAAAAGTSDLMIGGIDPASWAADAALAHPAVRIWRSCGLHPWTIGDDIDGPLRALRAALEAGGASAVGEIGLDRARGRPHFERQQAAFAAQLRLSVEVGLPVLLHVVRAHGAALALLDEVPPTGGVVHGFSGAPEVAAEYVRRGLFISFGRMLLAPRAQRARAAAIAVPLERLLVETDAPEQLPGPGALVDVLAALAALRSEPLAVLEAATADNAQAAYRL